MRPKPSDYLSWKELDCRDGTPYPTKFITDGTVFKLAHTFDNIRKLIGNKPLIINSGYRSLSYNTTVGGSPGSQHLLGRALDIQSNVMSSVILYDIIFRNSIALGVRGLGLYHTFVHFDIRDKPELVTWQGYGSNQTTS